MGHIALESIGELPGRLPPPAGPKFAGIPNGLGGVSKVLAAGWAQIGAYGASCGVAQDLSPGTAAAAGDFGLRELILLTLPGSRGGLLRRSRTAASRRWLPSACSSGMACLVLRGATGLCTLALRRAPPGPSWTCRTLLASGTPRASPRAAARSTSSAAARLLKHGRGYVTPGDHWQAAGLPVSDRRHEVCGHPERPWRHQQSPSCWVGAGRGVRRIRRAVPDPVPWRGRGRGDFGDKGADLC